MQDLQTFPELVRLVAMRSTMYVVLSRKMSGTTLLELFFKMILCKVLLLIFLEPLAFAILIGTGDKGYFSASPKLIALPVFIL